MRTSEPIPVIYEDEYLLAIDKPAGLDSVPGPNVYRYVLSEFGRVGVFLLHRLDRNTSGILLLGKIRRHRTALEGILTDPDTVKTYTALVKGVVEKDSGVIKKMLPARTVDLFVNAITEYKVLKRFENVTLVEARIKTGRKHQIRLHFAGLGHPVVNDTEHGDFGWNKKFQRRHKTKRLFLHASSIEFTHPITKEHLIIRSELPPKLITAISTLIV
ncbi:MAG: RluA family pseudouridine synthase [Patescibacteria group bacterium]